LLIGDLSTKVSSSALLLLTSVVVTTIAAFATITSITSIQPAAATTANNNTMRIDLVVDTTTLKFQDVNNNTQPDSGEFAIVLGKLYAYIVDNQQKISLSCDAVSCHYFAFQSFKPNYHAVF
jgi:hypothetical protein